MNSILCDHPDCVSPPLSGPKSAVYECRICDPKRPFCHEHITSHEHRTVASTGCKVHTADGWIRGDADECTCAMDIEILPMWALNVMSYYDQITWSDIAYQEEHGVLPDQGATSSELREYYGDPNGGDYDPDHVREVERHVAEERMSQRIRELEDENAYLRDVVDAGCSMCGIDHEQEEHDD